MKMQRIALSLLLISSPLFADGSLRFAGGSDRVDFGNPSIYTNLPVLSVACWALPTGAITNALAFISKRDGVGSGWQFNTRTNGNLRVTSGGGTGNYIYDTTGGRFAPWDSPMFVAGTYDKAGPATQRSRFAVGYTTSSVILESPTGTDPTTYGSDAGANLYIGNTTSLANGFTGHIGKTYMFNRKITDTEMAEMQWMDYTSTSTIFRVNNGYNGAGTQYDESGNSINGTLVGPTASSVGLPNNLYGSAQ